MPKILNGTELAGYIKERQAKMVRSLKQASHIHPKLAIIQTNPTKIIDTYIRLKKAYGQDIGVEVIDIQTSAKAAPEAIAKLNNDPSIHGIIIQLPLDDPRQTDCLLSLVDPAKDIDGLNPKGSDFDPATPMAIIWLLNGYNVELRGCLIVLVGHGKLVGQPLSKILKDSGYDVAIVDSDTPNIKEMLNTAQVIITATGVAGLITSEMIPKDCTVVDAGVAVEAGVLLGDLSPDVYERSDLTISPKRGGVGPLTVCALFENVIIASSQSQVG